MSIASASKPGKTAQIAGLRYINDGMPSYQRIKSPEEAAVLALLQERFAAEQKTRKIPLACNCAAAFEPHENNVRPGLGLDL